MTGYYQSRPYTVKAFRVGPSEKEWRDAGDILKSGGAFNVRLSDDDKNKCWLYVDCQGTTEVAYTGDWVVEDDDGRMVIEDAQFRAKFYVEDHPAHD